MITLLIETYLSTLVSIGLSAIFIFLIGLYFIFRNAKYPHPTNRQKHKRQENQPIVITSHDINAIAGDDTIATQLDLARAYIETGRQQLAKNILSYVIKQGNIAQQREARSWLNNI